MAFLSFIGRVIFVSAFILSAWQEYNDRSATSALRPKYDAFSQQVLSHIGFKLPSVEMKYLVASAIALKVVGSLLFIFGSSFGAFLLLLQQAVATPILYDFYNYDADKKQYSQLFTKFTQSMQIVGALLFFIGMDYKIMRRQVRKKSTKRKTK